MRKLWPTLFGLTLGALALWLFFARLFTLFRAERDDGAREAAAHRAALEAYALAEVTAAVRGQLQAASEQLAEARRDPLLDDSALYLVVQGAQVVPPVAAPEPQPGATATDDSPLARRKQLEGEIHQAINRHDRALIERLIRALLAERARYVLPLQDDAPIILGVVRALQQAGPSPELLRMLLRDGVSLDGRSVPQGLEGLQRAVLRRRTKLTAPQLAQWCGEVARVSREARVPAADFESRCQSQSSPRPPPWQLLEGESFWRPTPSSLAPAEGRTPGDPSQSEPPRSFRAESRNEGAPSPTWFLRTRDQHAEGVAVDLGALVLELTERLRARQLLSARDRLVFEVPPGSSALSAQAVALVAPEADLSARKREDRFLVKSALLGLSAALTLAIAALAVLAQRRKLRFVELKSDFVATVSHELRTPLASMRVMAETLERRLEGHGAAKDYPARIVREVDGLSALVENILSFNRLDKGRWQRRDGEVVLSALEPVLREEAARYPAAKVELWFKGFAGVVLSADLELVQLLLLNLLRNACKYNGSDPVVVQFEWAGTTLRVSDNGVGIPPAELEHVFVEFHRLPGQRGRGGAGSGLGLALARRIMGLHQGSIAVERSSPAGTTFVLRFGASAPR